MFTKVYSKKHFILTLSLILGLATSVSADIKMICDAANNEKRYYKLVQSFSGTSTVEQKLEAQWVNWFNKPYREYRLVKFELYDDDGAMMVLGTDKKWDGFIPSSWEIVAGKEYYVESSYFLDFEFGVRTVKWRVYEDETRAKEIEKHGWRDWSREFSCEIQK